MARASVTSVCTLAIVLMTMLLFVEGWTEIDCPNQGALFTDTCADYEQAVGQGNSSPWSCSPFPFRSYPDNCGNPDNDIIAGDGNGGTDGTNDVGVWANFDDNGPSNYFVFHSCDGAGGMTDCKGNQNFIEQFSDWCGDGSDWSQCENQCDSSAPGSFDGSAAQHQQCSKWHDGTKKFYNWYKCGNWFAASQFGYSWNGWNEWMPWFQQLMDQTYVDTYKPDGTLVLYDWVCHKDTSLVNGAKKNLEPFTDDAEVNCYCDNEPFGEDDQSASFYEPPPGHTAYAFWKKYDGEGKLYLEMHDLSSGTDNGDGFTLYPFEEPW